MRKYIHIICDNDSLIEAYKNRDDAVILAEEKQKKAREEDEHTGHYYHVHSVEIVK